jgi:tetratricopeptide (TPR) repeat protein
MVDNSLCHACALQRPKARLILAFAGTRLLPLVGACLTALVILFATSGCATNPSPKSGAAMTSSIDIDTLWDFSKPAESEARFREALAHANADEALELETQIARTHGLRRDSQKALSILDGVRQKVTAKTSEVVRVREALERGRTLRTPKDFEVARPYFQEAFDRAMSANLTILAIDAAHMFGFSPDLDEAQRWNQRALDLANASELPAAIRWRSTLTHNMGVSERARKNYSRALSLFQATEKAEESLNRPARMRVVRWQIANTLRLQGRIDEALAIQLRIEKDADDAKSPDVYIYTELAELYAAPGVKRDAQKAKRYAGLALAMADKDTWIVENEASLIARMKDIRQN